MIDVKIDTPELSLLHEFKMDMESALGDKFEFMLLSPCFYNILVVLLWK